ncbi:hypothetical protein [Aeromicrobium sp. NPDC092404]|uniref:hypothetical protein n=1 Tax=Aeromicrobium sp. NPDC092404 TaxID=3154976 RepID=UPI00343D1EA2
MSPTDATTQIAELMRRFLASVSFGAGERPHYDAIPALFIDRGLLIKNIAGAAEISTPAEFIAPRRALVESGELTEFLEEELSATTTVFGAVAHRLSEYAKSGVQGGTAFSVRGVILTQLVATPEGWRISSMTWDDERPGLDLSDLRTT